MRRICGYFLLDAIRTQSSNCEIAAVGRRNEDQIKAKMNDKGRNQNNDCKQGSKD